MQILLKKLFSEFPVIHRYSRYCSFGLSGQLWVVFCLLLTGFNAIAQQTLKDHYVFQDDQMTCTSGAARYKLALSQGTHYGISDEFAASVCKLPLNYDQSVYKQFIEDWGTVSLLRVMSLSYDL